MGGISRYWVGVGWVENLREDWKEIIGEVLQLPYAYCIHDKDCDSNGEIRKAHIHLIVCWPNTTTKAQALRVFRGLDSPGLTAAADLSDPADGDFGSPVEDLQGDHQDDHQDDQQKKKKQVIPSAFNTVHVVYGMRFMYNYLIHDTEDCRKKGKFQYEKTERITGNGFDIGFLEQLSVDEKNEALDEIVQIIKAEKIIDMLALYESLTAKERGAVYREVLKGNSGLLKSIVAGNWMRLSRAEYEPKKDPAWKEEKKDDKSEV